MTCEQTSNYLIKPNHFTKVFEILALALCILTTQKATQAQSFSVLYSFGDGASNLSTNGSLPEGVLLIGNTLFSTAAFGGTIAGDPTYGSGTIFSVNTDGTGFTKLHSFTPLNPGNGKNSDGADPWAGLISSGNTLYGRTGLGGTNGNGTLFKINTDGTGFTTIYNTGWSIYVVSGNTIYGQMGNYISAVNTDGTGVRSIYGLNDFPAAEIDVMFLSGSTLYGTMNTDYYGNVFKINIDGSGFATLHTFSNGNDGADPAGLVISGNMLYGVANHGGANGNGTVFSVDTNGSGFSVLYSFSEQQFDPSPYNGYTTTFTNADGVNPDGLWLSGNRLYGTTYFGGTNGNGTIFAVNTDGTRFTTLHSFSGMDGVGPRGGGDGGGITALLAFSGNTLYGTASGPNETPETLFSQTISPPLGIVASSNQAVISWTASAPNYVLQTATDLFSGPWSNITNGIITNGLDYSYTETVTKRIAYFRLQER